MYLEDDVAEATKILDDTIAGCAEDPVAEIRTFGRTLSRWREEILNHHRTGASNGPTEGQNFCARQVKRAGRGFKKFTHYRLRVLLYAGGVAWPRPFWPRGSRHPVPTETGRAAFLRATAGATSSPQMVTTSLWSPRSLTRAPCRRTSFVMPGSGSTVAIRCLRPWRPAWRDSRRSVPSRTAVTASLQLALQEI